VPELWSTDAIPVSTSSVHKIETPVGTGKSLLSGAVLEAIMPCSTSSAHKIEALVGTRKPKPCLNLVSTLSQTCLNLSTLNSVSTLPQPLSQPSNLSQRCLNPLSQSSKN